MKKLAFVFILILMCLLPCASFAQGQFSYSFENPEEASLWSGGVFDGSNYFETGYPIYVNNPFGELKGELITHVLDYMPTLSLEGGKVYNLSGYVFNPLSAYSPSVRSSATADSGTNNIILSVSGIGDEWSRFSNTFYVGESGEYKLSIHFANGHTDFGFFADEFTLEEVSCTLASINISGQNEILIPAAQSVKSYYRPYLLTSDNESIDILSPKDVHFSVSAAQGTSFNNQEFSLTVTPEATAPSEVLIDCALRNHASLSPTSFLVSLTDNMIDDPSMSGETLMWTSSSKLSFGEDNGERFINVPTDDYGDFGYFATIKYTSSQILLKDVLYVVRARVRSDNSKPFSAIHAKNSAEVNGNTVYFSIKDISGEEWFDVFAAFVPEQSGIYDIALNLCSMYDCTISIDDIKLSCEELGGEYITLHAPGNIAVPVVPTQYGVSALLRDQLGNIIPSDNIELRLLEQNNTIFLENGILTLNPDTPAGTYTLFATYLTDPSITAKLDITVSFDYIGDGTFENTMPNEWWMVASPYDCDFYIRYDGQSRRGHINCRGNYFMLLNNSYVHLIQGTAYVFNSSFAVPTDCTATLFLEKLDGSILPLAQMFISSGATLDEKLSPELFLAEEDAVGRLFLYIESNNGEPFSVYTDNLSLKNASIMAISPRITGQLYVNGSADAQFILFNNIAENDDASYCVVNWFVSDSMHGEYTQLGHGEKSIYFDTTFLNKYVYFEVIPICPITGFSGEAAHSAPVLISYEPQDNEISLPMYTPVINWQKHTEKYFTDTKDHWGQEYIDALAHSQVVTGKSDGVFAPDDTVTRAEFSKMLSLSFSVNVVADNMIPFTDISKDDWYYPHTTSLYLAGIVNGTSKTTFSPIDALTREQAVTMAITLYEKATSSVAPMSDVSFSDEREISDWAKLSSRKAARLKIVQGFPDGSFVPKAPLTRAQAAAIIYNLAKILSKG